MRNLRELGATHGRKFDGNQEKEAKFPSALLATAGLDDKIFIWYPETGDIYKEYDLDPKHDSQVNNFIYKYCNHYQLLQNDIDAT